jgi:cytosine deaminase
MTRDPYLAEAVAEAEAGLAEGGIPIGSVLVIDGSVVGRAATAGSSRGR